MKRQVLSCICGALLIWTAFDDVIAAQTPDPDDDIAAALDNDYLQDATLSVLARAEAQRIMCTCPPHSAAIGPSAAKTGASAQPCGSRRLADLLYLFMSLQC